MNDSTTLKTLGMRKRWRHELPHTDGRRQPSEDLLTAWELTKNYQKGKLTIPVLCGVNFSVRPGEFCAIVGQSGSGKSTLLHLLATLDRPDSGTLYYEGNRIDNLSSSGRDVLRNSHFGMIFQFYHLLPELTALENVLLPSMISCGAWNYWRQRRKLRALAADLLSMVSLSHRVKHRPHEMSGGEMQRVAIARALMSNPRVLFADEPTGNLDRQTGTEIMGVLRSLNEDRGLTIVMVTHDHRVAESANRVVTLADNGLFEGQKVAG